MKRKYDLGNDVIIEDDGYSLRADIKTGETGRTSIGVPRPKKLGETAEVTYSRGGDLFYLNGFAMPIHGFWLGTEKFESAEAAKAKMPDGIFGKAFAKFQDAGQEPYFRMVFHFTGWDIKSDSARRNETISVKDPLAVDYLSLIQNEHRDLEKKFNEAIAHTGKNLAYIMEHIGWEFAPIENPPVVPI